MSEATLRSLVSIVLSSGAIPKIHFRIEGYTVYSECFTRLKTAIRGGEIGLEIDDARLSKIHAVAGYNPRLDTMYLHSSVLKATAISQESRAAIIHECLHAVLDMDFVSALSPYQEEAACALTTNIYVFHHFGRPFFTANGPATTLTRAIARNPGMDITQDGSFLEIYERIAQIYDADDPEYGRRPGLHNGLRKRL